MKFFQVVSDELFVAFGNDNKGNTHYETALFAGVAISLFKERHPNIELIGVERFTYDGKVNILE